MFSLYSKGCEYAIQALVEMASQKTGTKFLARDICRKADIPEAYARKTFQALVQCRFLTAVPGPGGGYSLTRDPAKTTVMDVIEAVDGAEGFSRCILGFDVCGNHNPCSLHTMWVELKSKMLGMLASESLLDLSRDLKRKSAKNLKQGRVR